MGFSEPYSVVTLGLYYVMLYYVILYYVILYYIILYYIILYYIILFTSPHLVRSVIPVGVEVLQIHLITKFHLPSCSDTLLTATLSNQRKMFIQPAYCYSILHNYLNKISLFISRSYPNGM
jgi:hypothetical protein